jgi:hypothetical protein
MNNEKEGPQEGNSLSMREGSGAKDAAIHRISKGILGGMRLAYGGRVDRSGRAHAMTRQYYVWAGFTGVAMVTPALHRHANRLQRLPCRQSLGFEGNLSLQVNQASWMR